jgi:hypothetical protein
VTDKEIILLDALRKLEAMATDVVEVFDPDNHPDDYTEIYVARQVLAKVMGCSELSFLGPRIPHAPSSCYRLDWAAVYWCDVHDRRATGKDSSGNPVCAQSLGGITMPCKCRYVAGQKQ